MVILHHYEDEEDTFDYEASYERHLKEELSDTSLGSGGIGFELAEELAEKAARKEELEWYRSHGT